MARRVNARTYDAPEATDAPETPKHDATPMTGGSAGVLDDAVKEVGGGAGKVTASAKREPKAEAPSPPTKKYEVFGAGPQGRHVRLNGYKCIFRDGKIVDSKDYSVEDLYAQGISLREIKSEE